MPIAMAFGRFEKVKRGAPFLAFCALGCGNGNSAPIGAGGSGGAGSVVDSGADDDGALDSGFFDSGVLDSFVITCGADGPAADGVADPDATDGDASKPTIAILVDDILGGPFSSIDASDDAGEPGGDAS